MDTVKTFVRYVGLTNRDPFDDVRMLNFYSRLADVGVDYQSYFELLAEMASVLHYARTREPLDGYTMTYDLKNDDGSDFTLEDAIDYVMSSFKSNKIVNVDSKLDTTGHIDEFDLDPTNLADRALMKHEASKKKNAVNVLLSNIIQVGASMDVVLDMEYVQAVDFINHRAKILKEQYKREMQARRKG